MTTEFFEERLADGSVLRKPGTRWRALGPVTLDLTPSAQWSVEKQRFTNLEGDPAKANVHVREWVVALRTDEQIVLPSEMDNAIEQRVCREPGCRLAMRCRNLGHRSDVIGGLSGGRLVRVDPDPSVFAARLHPSLVAPSGPMPSLAGASGDLDVDARLLARAQATRRSAS
jgi:hypothetical protein